MSKFTAAGRLPFLALASQRAALSLGLAAFLILLLNANHIAFLAWNWALGPILALGFSGVGFLLQAAQREWKADLREHARVLAPLAGVLALAILYWASSIDRVSLWADEASTWQIASMPLSSLRDSIRGHLMAMPGYYVFLHYWIRGVVALGVDPAHWEFVMRLPSLAAHAASALILTSSIHALVLRSWGKGWGQRAFSVSLGLGFFALPSLLAYAVEARTYADAELWMAMLTAWGLTLVLCPGKRTPAEWGVYCALLAWAGTSHLFCAIAGLGIGLGIALTQMGPPRKIRASDLLPLAALAGTFLLYRLASAPFTGAHPSQHPLDWGVFFGSFGSLFLQAKTQMVDGVLPGWTTSSAFGLALLIIGGLRLAGLPLRVFFALLLTLDLLVPLIGMATAAKGYFIYVRQGVPFAFPRALAAALPAIGVAHAATSLVKGFSRGITLTALGAAIAFQAVPNLRDFTRTLEQRGFSTKIAYDFKEAWIRLEKDSSVRHVVVVREPEFPGFDWDYVRPLYDRRFSVEVLDATNAPGRPAPGTVLIWVHSKTPGPVKAAAGCVTDSLRRLSVVQCPKA